jgi:hypothetical protein
VTACREPWERWLPSSPTTRGEGNGRPGNGMNGKVPAIGYMKGILDALGLP